MTKKKTPRNPTPYAPPGEPGRDTSQYPVDPAEVYPETEGNDAPNEPGKPGPEPINPDPTAPTTPEINPDPGPARPAGEPPQPIDPVKTPPNQPAGEPVRDPRGPDTER